MFKFIIAFLAGKILKLALKIFKRRGTHWPGKIAWKICPDFLKYIAKPKHIICITGTNGKTTCSNLIEDSLKHLGVKFVDNSFGSNTTNGVIATLLDSVSIFNKSKIDTAVLEVDERSSVHIYKYLTPDFIVCTNLFRDSVNRNAHTEFIFSIINDSIPKGTRLILNADDVISSRLGTSDNPKVFFGIDKLKGEIEEKNIINDGKNCPSCGNPMIFSFRRYHHIGRAKCSVCGLETPVPDTDCLNVDYENNTMTVKIHSQAKVFPLINQAIYNIYNEVAVITFLDAYGVELDKIYSCMENIYITKTRLRERTAGNVHIISQMLKGLNPIACSRTFHMAQNLNGKKQVMIMVDDLPTQKKSTENTCWYYESDFEALNDNSIEKIYIIGIRHLDIKLRLLLSGIDEEKIIDGENEQEVLDRIALNDCDTFIIFFDMFRDDITANLIEPSIEKKAAERN